MDSTKIHVFFILIHALAATTSFVSGCFVLYSPKYSLNRRVFSLYHWSLLGMTVFLAGAMIVRWPEYTEMEQVAFSGLFGLAVYIVYRGTQAHVLLQTRHGNWRTPYIHHIGFTLISLFEGFIIVALIKLSAPEWFVILIAIVGVLGGQRIIDIVESRRDLYIRETDDTNP